MTSTLTYLFFEHRNLDPTDSFPRLHEQTIKIPPIPSTQRSGKNKGRVSPDSKRRWSRQKSRYPFFIGDPVT